MNLTSFVKEKKCMVGNSCRNEPEWYLEYRVPTFLAWIPYFRKMGKIVCCNRHHEIITKNPALQLVRDGIIHGDKHQYIPVEDGMGACILCGSNSVCDGKHFEGF